MVFLIQNSQNRDGAAIQAKLDELIRVSTARNSFVGIEHLTDDEIDAIREKCECRAKAEKTSEKEALLTGKKTRRAADRVTDRTGADQQEPRSWTVRSAAKPSSR